MKPMVICHMMGPLDGQLVVEDWAPSTGHSPDDLVAEYDRVHDRLDGDAWLSGRAVGEEFAEGEPHPPADAAKVERPIHVARSGAAEYAVLIDEGGKLHWTGPETYGSALVMVLGRDVPDVHLAELAADGISYIVCEDGGIDLDHVLDVLAARFGIRRLILEGGAGTNAAFFRAGLVNQVSLVLFPAIGGRERARGLFDAGPDGLAGRVRLTHGATTPGELGSVHLLYDVAYTDD